MSAARFIAIVCSLLALPTASASAQGFFESLFGFGGAQRSHPAMRQNAPSSAPYREPVRRPAANTDAEISQPSSGGRFRTMCVRTCDGYYFPIRNSVSPRQFHLDAQMCSRSCGTDAKLYYHPSSSGDSGTMIDLAGQPYARLPNAFRYRKQRVAGCACRPEPWSASELERHQRYAASGASVASTMEADPSPSVPAEQTASSSDINPPSQEPTVLASEVDAPADARAPRIEPQPIPVASPRPRAEPRSRSRGQAPVTAARYKSADRPRPPPPASLPSGLFGLPINGPQPTQKALRWPGD